MSKKITILSVSWYSASLLNDMIDDLVEKSDDPNNLEFIIIDNSNGADKELVELNSKKTASINIFINDTNGYKNLSAHALGLNFGFTKVKSDYLLIVDPDIHLFKEHWDRFFIDELEKSNLDFIGSPYPSWWLGTYHNFPSPIFCFSKYTTICKLTPDWLPKSVTFSIKLRNFILRQLLRGGFLFNKQRLFKYPFLREFTKNIESHLPLCSIDTGSQLREKASQLNMKIATFDSLYSDSEIVKSHNKKERLQELTLYYELYAYNREVILTHQYGSQNLLLGTKKGSDKEYWKKLYRLI